MRAPEFWARGGLASLLLLPAAGTWAAVGALRRLLTRPERPPVRVVCIGNLVAGGGGKTPLVLAVCRRLVALGRTPHVLSRGHGGRLKGPLRVDPGRHTARDVGDEPLMLAAHGPVWIGADRAASARAAAAAGADVVVMDDGFQNPGLAKDLSILAVDGAYGLGNGRVMPAGPLREPVRCGLARAQAVVLAGADRHGLADRLGAPDRPVLQAALRPGPEALALAGVPVYAFAGIARPEKFFATLEQVGVVLAGSRGFPDHHAYGPDEIMEMAETAQRLGARLVTTEKDHVRLDPEARPMAEAIPVTLVLDDPAALDVLLARALERRP